MRWAEDHPVPDQLRAYGSETRALHIANRLVSSG